MVRIISIVSALAITMTMSACSEKATPSIKDELTDPSLVYTLEELEALEAGEHYSFDYDVPALYKYYEDYMYIGNIVNSWNFDNDSDMVTRSLMKNFNIYTMENDYKPSSINPAPGVYNLDSCDKFIEFGKKTGAKLRGHTLVWHSQVPDWWFKADPTNEKSLGACHRDGELASAEQLIERMEEYITTVVTRYKGQIDYWDVCNEVLNANSIRTVDDQSYWAEIIGDLDGNGYADDYVELAFQYARAADEDAVLMINDFNIEWQDSKSQAMYDMVERFLRNGTRIDGVGFQCHVSVEINVEDVKRNMDRIAELAKVYDECFPEHKGGFRMQVTELDMNMFVGSNSDKNFVRWTDEDHSRQAEVYAELMELFLSYAKDGLLDAVVFWCPDDAHSWIARGNGLPSIYDSESKLKPCYYSIVKTVLESE